jgi:hypothetical protein
MDFRSNAMAKLAFAVKMAKFTSASNEAAFVCNCLFQISENLLVSAYL